MNRAASAIGAAVMLIAVLTGAPAHAASPASEMQERVNAVLEEYPGGTQTGWNEIVWDEGAVTLELAPPAANVGIVALAVVGGCSSGKFCAYNQTGYFGDKITFSTCASTHSVSNLPGSVRSIANSRTSGTIRAYAGSTLLASASAGAGANVTGTTTKISCT